MITIDTKSTEPKYLQVFEQFKAQILDGTYAVGSKLPPIRTLATELNISRNTVEAAYMHLSQEGFVNGRTGSGYIVDNSVLTHIESNARPGREQREFIARLAKDGIWDSPQQKDKESVEYDLCFDRLQSGSFPAQIWRRLAYEIICSPEAQDMNAYPDKLGLATLREQIAQIVKIGGNVNCHPAQVCVQAGTQAALNNLLMLFDPLRDVVAMENPGYTGARNSFESAKYKLFPLPVYKDEVAFIDGLYNSHAKLAYVTPASQFPTGRVMQSSTRRQLISWADSEDAYIIEDDYNREFHHTAQSGASLYSMDVHDRVVYMGSFSATISPAIRLSYLILPPELLYKWHSMFSGYCCDVSWLSQAVLARFIEKGYWNKHLRKMQLQNKRKHKQLLTCLQKHMGKKVEIMGSAAGSHVLVGVLDKRKQGELIELAREAGVKVYETNCYWRDPHHSMESFVLLGFSAISETNIEPAIERLANAWFD